MSACDIIGFLPYFVLSLYLGLFVNDDCGCSWCSCCSDCGNLVLVQLYWSFTAMYSMGRRSTQEKGRFGKKASWLSSLFTRQKENSHAMWYHRCSISPSPCHWFDCPCSCSSMKCGGHLDPFLFGFAFVQLEWAYVLNPSVWNVTDFCLWSLCKRRRQWRICVKLEQVSAI